MQKVAVIFGGTFVIVGLVMFANLSSVPQLIRAVGLVLLLIGSGLIVWDIRKGDSDDNPPRV